MSKAADNVKVSVVIPTKNAGPQLRHVLNAVMAQQTSWIYEVLVIDSGSTDGTVDLVKKYSSVILIEISASDFGHGKTRNYAISKTKGDYIAMLTQDAIPATHHWLTELVNAIEMDTRIAGVFGRHIAHSEASAFTHYELEQHFHGFSCDPLVEMDDRIRYETDEGYRQFLYFFSDNNALLRRTVWQQIPYPNIEFAEDQAWARLIIEAGYRKSYAHNAVVSHSHEYGFFERLQRSFDESYALHRLFNYQYGQGFIHAVRNFLGMTVRDFKFTFKESLHKINLRHVISMPLNNFMRVFGYYLGANGSHLSETIRSRLSRDRNLKMNGNSVRN